MSDPIASLRRRQRFILDDDDLKLLEAMSKPRLLLLSDQRTPQDMANEAWQALALKHQFEWDSVKPSTDTLDRGIIRAIPLDPNRQEPDLPAWAIPADNDKT
jgi:hypothetical protein